MFHFETESLILRRILEKCNRIDKYCELKNTGFEFNLFILQYLENVIRIGLDEFWDILTFAER